MSTPNTVAGMGESPARRTRLSKPTVWIWALTVLTAVLLFVSTALPATRILTFAEYPAQVWPEGTVHGDWYVRYNGYGHVAVERPPDTGDHVLVLQPTIDPPAQTGTSAAMVTSVTQTSGDLTLTARMRTVSQNAVHRDPPAPPDSWEVAWLYWNLTYRPGGGDEGTGKAIGYTGHGYYLTLKPTGWEVGKLDQARFVGLGGQRFLATGTTPQFPVGPAWRDVRIEQVGATITVTVDGARLIQVTDGPGSGGSAAWWEHPDQEVYTAGSIGLYTEDARAEFDGVVVSSPG